ncbi:MAG: hypothetical protein MJ231_07410 [bacterium]|nr:hypothetical protein [bacterium]
MNNKYYVENDYTKMPILSFDVSKYINETEVNNNPTKDKYIKSICRGAKNNPDIIANLYNSANPNLTKRTNQNVDNLGNTIIDHNIEAKTIPIVLRKRLLLQRMVS